MRKRKKKQEKQRKRKNEWGWHNWLTSRNWTSPSSPSSAMELYAASDWTKSWHKDIDSDLKSDPILSSRFTGHWMTTQIFVHRNKWKEINRERETNKDGGGGKERWNRTFGKEKHKQWDSMQYLILITLSAKWNVMLPPIQSHRNSFSMIEITR